MRAEDLCCYFPVCFISHGQLAIIFAFSLVFIQQTGPVHKAKAMCVSPASFLLGDCSTILCSCGHATKKASCRIGASSFEKKITSREDLLITEIADVLKDIINFMGKTGQIPFISSKDSPH